jgi:glutathione peroxidase
MDAYEFSARSIDGNEVPLSKYRGHPLLVVNVASKCGFTPQYAGLEALYKKYHKLGLEVLGFPCDQFGHQEPGTEADIKKFCSLTYGVSFPMFAKIEVNGDDAHPLYKYLKDARPGILGLEAIKWNFTKFLVGRDGVPVKRFAPTDTPKSIEPDVKAVLRSPKPVRPRKKKPSRVRKIARKKPAAARTAAKKRSKPPRRPR